MLHEGVYTDSLARAKLRLVERKTQVELASFYGLSKSLSGKGHLFMVS